MNLIKINLNQTDVSKIPLTTRNDEKMKKKCYYEENSCFITIQRISFLYKRQIVCT